MVNDTPGTDDSAPKENTDAYEWVNQVPQIGKAVTELTEFVKAQSEKTDSRFSALEEMFKSTKEEEAVTKDKDEVAKTKKQEEDKKEEEKKPKEDEEEAKKQKEDEDKKEEEEEDKDKKTPFPIKTKKSEEEISELKDDISKMAKAIEELKAPKETDKIQKSVSVTETEAPATGPQGSNPREKMNPIEYARQVADKFKNPQVHGEFAGNAHLVDRFRDKANQLEKLQPKVS